ncbi:hypothetical protein V2J09_015456 [Rumex salicifolius]
MPRLITPKSSSCKENCNPNSIASHVQALISDKPSKPSEPLTEKSTLSCSLKRKRAPTIQIPSVLREIKVDSHLKSAEDRSFLCYGDVRFGVSSVKGKKKLMEDAHKVVSCIDGNPTKGFFGVYDGHGGRKAAEFVSENLHTNMLDRLVICTKKETKIEAVKAGYLKTDKDFLELDVGSGACCVTAVIEENEMIISNLGDCRAVLCRGRLAEALTKDHTAEQIDERKRIEDKGGYVEVHRGGWRVHGLLSVSRSIGDAHLKSWVVAEPDTLVLNLDSDMDFIVLASDGLWGKVGNQEAVDVVLRSGSTGKKSLGLAEELCKENSSSPKIKRVSVVKQKKMTGMSPSHGKKTDENVRADAYELDTENESPPSKMRRTSLFPQSVKSKPVKEDNSESIYKGLVTACKELVNLALSRGSLDDITVMVIDLNHFRGRFIDRD